MRRNKRGGRGVKQSGIENKNEAGSKIERHIERVMGKDIQ